MSHGGAPSPHRIVLVGFMAAGKTTVGALLAERLGWSFVDVDATIRERTGRTAGDIIRQDGEPAFRALEADVTAELGSRRDVVVAPGGGWAGRPELMDALGPGTLRVWLRVSPEVALERAEAESVDRPLLGPPDGRLERARALLERREPWFAAAELAVDANDEDPAVVAGEILRRLGLKREDDER